MNTKKNISKETLTASVFIVLIGFLFIANLIAPSPGMLEDERRAASGFPEIDTVGLLSGSFMERFELWAADSFVFRRQFRALNAYRVFDIYRQNDNSGLYRDSAAGYGTLRTADKETIEKAAGKIKSSSAAFDGIEMNIYYSIIPDKSAYASKYLPGFDVSLAESVLSEKLQGFKYIGITGSLDAGSFYKTDLHWNQTMLNNAALQLLREMGADGITDESWEIAGGYPFYGVFAGQYALPVMPDTLTYANIAPSIGNLSVSYLCNSTLELEKGPLYDESRLDSIDPYDFFLQGPQPIVVIENGDVPQGRELYIFRDSFGSSLAPLLIEAYSVITLIDLRYIHVSMLGRYIDFTPGSDVLFIYSPQILCNPDALQS